MIFYDLSKLPALISVRGFRTSQRLRALSPAGPRYLALHSVADLAVLQSAEYQAKGGGNFARWQPHITDWRRNLYAGLERAPEVAADELLALSAVGPASLLGCGLRPWSLAAVALDQAPQQRWLATLKRAACAQIEAIPPDVCLYMPITQQLVSADA